MSQRDPYLVNKMFRGYLVATILATMSTSLGVVVNSMVVGNVLGSGPLGAVNLASPLIQLIATVTMIIGAGGSTLLALNIGKGRLDNAQRIFTCSLAMAVAATAAFTLIGIFASDLVAGALCRDATLLPLVTDYVRIALIGSATYIFLPVICMFVRTDSAPRHTTVAFIVSTVVGICTGFVLMSYFGMGIAGSGIGTVVGYIAGIAVTLLHFRKESVILKIRGGFRTFAFPSLVLGAPVALWMGLTMVKMFTMNSATLAVLGASGATALAVCMNVMMLSTMFNGGTAQTLQPVGGTLYGSEDLHGVRIAVRMAFKYLVAVLIAITLLAIAWPQLFLDLFGVSDPEGLASRALRVFAVCFLFSGLNYLLIVIYQVFGNKMMSILVSVLECAFVVGFTIALASASPENIWWSFPAGEGIAFAVILVVAMIVRRRDQSLDRFTLMRPVEGESADFSVTGSAGDLGPLLDEADAFLADKGVDRGTADKVRLCCEELVKNIMDHGLSNDADRCIDLIYRVNGGAVNVTIRDDGEIFDPVDYDSEGLGIPIAKGMCTTLKYSRNLGQNNVFLTFGGNA